MWKDRMAVMSHDGPLKSVSVSVWLRKERGLIRDKQKLVVHSRVFPEMA